MPLVPFHEQAIDPNGHPVHVQVTVYYRGTTNEADSDIFAYATGGARSNPFESTDGYVDFWANPGAYDVKIEDVQNVPPLYATRTVGFDAVSGDNNGIMLKQIAADMLRQAVPIGAVIDWWRPAPPAGQNPPPVPDGFDICDGHAVPSGSHDFPITGGITLPDLRNVFVIGADSAKADTTGAANAQGAANAPGIRGVGGSNDPKNLQHSHTVNAHAHNVNAHYHRVPSSTGLIAGDIAIPDASQFTGQFCMEPGWTVDRIINASLPGGISRGVSAVDIYWINSESTSTGTDNQSPGTNSQLSSTLDVRPSFYGLLKIMKVRRA